MKPKSNSKLRILPAILLAVLAVGFLKIKKAKQNIFALTKQLIWSKLLLPAARNFGSVVKQTRQDSKHYCRDNEKDVSQAHRNLSFIGFDGQDNEQNAENSSQNKGDKNALIIFLFRYLVKYHVAPRQSDYNMTFNTSRKIRYSRFLPAILLAVLAVGMMPIPARAALGIDFDVNPKEVGSGTRPALNFNVRLSGIDPTACPNPSVNKFYMVISKSEGTAPPPTDRAHLFQQIGLSQDTVTWNPVSAESFGTNTVLNFKAFAACTAVTLPSTFIPTSDVKIQSEPVSVKTKGFDPNSDKFKATLTFEPAEVQFGGTVKFTLTVKDQTSTFGNGTGELSVCDSELKNCADSFVKVNGKGRSISGSFVVDPAKGFKEGANTIFGRMAYVEAVAFGTTTYKFDALAILNVKKSSQSVPSVTASEKSTTGTPGGTVLKVFTITYLDGGTGKRPTSYKIFCGEGGELKNQTLTEFTCQYPLSPAKTYQGKIQAINQAGEEIVAGAFTAAVTGTEDRGGAPSATEQGIGGGILGLVNSILGIIVAILRWIIWALGTIIFVPLLETTLSIEASNITPPVVAGWTIVRDVVNMFFILILIVIGFGTMLRIEAYNYKKLLVNLIVMALLVNFSLLIGRIIIQIADTAQFSFLSADEGVSSVKELFVKLTTSQIPSVTEGFFQSSGSGALAVTFSIIFQFILELGVIITFAALAIFMLIRTIALYILLIISPLAYALFVLPATAGLAKKWWSNFIKYAMFAPVIAFFLKLTGILYNSGFAILPVNKIYTAESLEISADFSAYLRQIGGTTGAIQFKDSLQLGIIYVVILAFLWAGMIVTKNMGIFGAAAIVGLAEKGMKAPFALGAKGLGALGGLVMQAYSGAVGRKIGEASKRGEFAAREAKLAERKLKRAKTDKEREKYSAQLEAARAKQSAASRASIGWRALSLLNPKVVAEAWKKRREEKELRNYAPAIGHMQDTFNRIIPTEWAKLSRLVKGEFGKKTYHGLIGERAVVSKESEELLKGVRTREDAAQILQNAFKSGDHDEIMAALKVAQHGNWQDDYMNIEGEKFSPIRYLNDITKKMADAGFSHEETRTILDDLKETAEAQGRARAYGLTTMDPDGVVRAANDLSYYAGQSATDLSKSIQDIGEKFKLAAEETGNADFKQVSDMFLRSAGRAAAGESFDQIAKSERYGAKDNQTFDFAMTERRFMDEANIKFRRGNAGLHARAMEAAIFVDQDPETGWDDHQNLMGQMLIHELPPNVASSITGRIHESQARLVEGFGGFRDEANGKWSLPDLEIAYKTDVQINTESAGDARKAEFLKQQREKHKVNLDKILASRMLGPKFFSAVATSTRLFAKDQRDKFAKQFNFIKNSASTSTNPDLQRLINEISQISAAHNWEGMEEDQPAGQS